MNANGINTNNLYYIPLENDFDSGTILAHFEEGIDSNYNTQYRIIDNILYPVIRNEITTGFIDENNYLTPMTLGCLEDIGYTVNYESNYVVSKGTKLNIIT